jgi:two-component system sensor kinase Ihk
MFLKKGIVRKTFIFSSLLIVLVVMTSFAVMYFAMPEYYLYKKEQMLQQNLDALVDALKHTDSPEACKTLIADFVESNNATVLTFDAGQTLLVEMSSPFVSMQEVGANMIYKVIDDPDINNRKVASFFTVAIRQDEASGETKTGTAEFGIAIKSSTAVQENEILTLSRTVGSALLGTITVAGTLQPIDEANDVILSLIPYVLVIGLAIGFLLAWIYARQISKPILRISDAAVRMQCMEPDAEAGVHTDDELGRLSDNLDGLYANLRRNLGDLRGEMEKVSRLERSKTEMMQSASHELKTPISALSGMLDGMLDNVGVYKNRDKYLLECKEQVGRLSALVSEILNASRADMCREEIILEDTSVGALIERALEDYDMQIRGKRLLVEKELLPTVIVSDPSVLYRVMTNLVSNAVRYTQHGGIINISLSEERFSIENNCAPIPDAELERLFEPFYTRSMSRDKTESGTGLGLYIVKRNLERLGIKYDVAQTGTGLKISLIW